jgi:hypothetical protein
MAKEVHALLHGEEFQAQRLVQQFVGHAVHNNKTRGKDVKF